MSSLKWVVKVKGQSTQWIDVANEAEAREATWSRGEYGVVILEGDNAGRYIKASPKRILSREYHERRNAKRRTQSLVLA